MILTATTYKLVTVQLSDAEMEAWREGWERLHLTIASGFLIPADIINGTEDVQPQHVIEAKPEQP